MKQNKTSALKEEIMLELEKLPVRKRCVEDWHEEIIDLAIRKTQEDMNNIIIAHEKAYEQIIKGFQSKIKELEEQKYNCKKHGLGMFWCPTCANEEINKSKFETIRKVEEMIKQECVMDVKPADEYENGVHKTGLILLKRLKRL